MPVYVVPNLYALFSVQCLVYQLNLRLSSKCVYVFVFVFMYVLYICIVGTELFLCEIGTKFIYTFIYVRVCYFRCNVCISVPFWAIVMDFLRLLCAEERRRTVFEHYNYILLRSMNIIVSNASCNSNMTTYCDSRSEYFLTKYVNF